MTQLQHKTTAEGNAYVTGGNSDEKQQAPRSPLPVGRFLQRGSLAPKRVEVSNDDLRGMVPIASCSSSGGEDTDAGEESESESERTINGSDGWSSRSSVCGGGTDAAIELAMALLRKLQQEAVLSSSSADDRATESDSSKINGGSGVAVVKKEELDQILAGFAKALESGASSERGVIIASDRNWAILSLPQRR